MAKHLANAAEMGKYCLLCQKEFGPHLKECCTRNSLVAMEREGFLKKRIRYFSLDGQELDEDGLSGIREIAAATRASIDREPATQLEPGTGKLERSPEGSLPVSDMRRDFVKFLASPDRHSYLCIRGLVVASGQYNPYSDEPEKVDQLLQDGQLEEARSTISEALPNLLLSPRAHLVLAVIAEKTGDKEAAQAERLIARICAEGILASGSGSRAEPYPVVRTSDEYDVLSYLGKELKLQELVHDGGRHLDVMRCEDGSEIWFDVTDAFDRLFR